MTEPINDVFPGESTLYSGDPVGDVLTKLESQRQPETLSAVSAAYLQKLSAQSNYRQANRNADHDLASQAVDGHFGQTSEARNLHEAAFSESTAEPEGDLDHAGLGRALGLADASVLEGSADDSIAEVRHQLAKIVEHAGADEVFAALEAEPKAGLELIRRVETALDKLASPTFGYAGSRSPAQADACERVLVACVRQSLAHRRLKAPIPPLPTLISRARLLTDASYAPGKRGHRAEIVAPVDTPRSIHHALMANPS